MSAKVMATNPLSKLNDIKTLKSHVDFRTLDRIENQLIGNTDISPKELLRYQILAQKFQLRIEFASRVADSINSGIKKLQTHNQ